MGSLGEQIASAVAYAIGPQSSQEERHGAYVFLQQVKEAHQETWQSCLGMFVGHKDGSAQDRWGNEVRMFACQVVGESLASLGPEALAYVQSSLFEYFASEYVQGSAEHGVTFLKNASILLATQLFLRVYLTMTPEFFSHFVGLLRQYPPSVSTSSSSPPPFNPKTTDLLLRLLHEVSTEVSDVQLRLNKPTTRLNEDSRIRDAFRENDAPRIASTLWQIVADSLAGLASGDPASQPAVGLEGKAAGEIAEMAIRVAGDYVSWIDINLMVTPTSMPLLLQAIHLPSPAHLPIRTATADTLLETVSKGMPPSDKIALVNVLDIKSTLEQLASFGRTGTTVEPQDEASETFRTKLAALLNGTGVEMCRIVDDTSAPEEARSQAHAVVTSLLPLLLAFLGDTNDSTSSAVQPFASAILSLYKKEKKRAVNDPTNGMTNDKRLFLTELLKTALAKMTYGPEDDWELAFEGEEDDDTLAFYEKRKSLRTISDAIAWIDNDLYSSAVRSVVVPSLEAFEAGATVPWQRLELALTLLYDYGTAFGNVGKASLVVIPPTDVARARKEPEFKLTYNAYPLSPLGVMLVRTCQAKVFTYPHGAVTLQFFECAVRYHDFFSLCPEFIADVLPSFMDEHGLHNEDAPVRARCCYLFSRFIYQTKSSVQAQVSGEVISNVLSRMQDLLSITPELPDAEQPDPQVLDREWKNSPTLDSQLYLFESVGTLISMLNQIPDQQEALLQAVMTPMLATLQANVRQTATTPNDILAVVEARHLIMAIGNVAKGFPDYSSRNSTAIQSAWAACFKNATEQVLAFAKSMNRFYIIRDAARFAFNRIVATTGEAILDLIPSLIECLVGEVSFPELGDLLNFITHLLAKFKSKFTDVLDQLFLPLFNRVIHFLNLPITGTDDSLQHSTLKRAYFAFLNAIMTSPEAQGVLYSDRNKPRLEDVLASIPHYIATPESQAADQKAGFGLLSRLANAWLPPLPTAAAAAAPSAGARNGNGAIAANGTPTPVPGFEQFLYNSVVKLCFEIPLRRDFDYSDAQSYQVIGEICSLLKTMSTLRGDEFKQFMTGTLFPSMQCPADAGASFIGALERANDGKAFKKHASEWFKNSRGPQ